MTADHLMPLLDTERDSAKLFALASSLAKGDVPIEVVEDGPHHSTAQVKMVASEASQLATF